MRFTGAVQADFTGKGAAGGRRKFPAYPNIWMVLGDVDELIKGDAAVGHKVVGRDGCVMEDSQTE